MFPPEFDYRRAETVTEALSLLSDHADRDVRLLAGGQGLVADLKAGAATPDLLVDVGDLTSLAGVTVAADRVTVGALATHAEVATSATVREHAPVLGATAEHVADLQVRNRGTVGGNLAEADPTADLPAAVVAADATLHVRGPEGERTVAATRFFEGEGRTVLGSDELLTGVSLPARTAGAYARETHPATGYAMAGVAATLDVADGVVSAAGVAATGVADRPVRLGTVEERVVGAPVEDVDPAAAAAGAAEPIAADRLVGDAHASGEYRLQLLPTVAERAVEQALEGAAAGGGPA